MSRYEKNLTDDELHYDKPRTKLFFPREPPGKKIQIRPVTAPKPPALLQSNRPPKSSDSSSQLKQKQRQILTDKEKLYEENLELKQKNNTLNDENLKLKTKLFQIEKELSKKEDCSESGKSGHLVSSLKQIVKDLKTQVQGKDSELENFRKNAKVSKVQELESEIKVYADECTRLKHHLTEVLKQQNSTIEVSSEMLEKNIQESMESEKIRKDNIEMGYKIEELVKEKENLALKLNEKKKVKKKTELNQKNESVRLKELLEKLQKDKASEKLEKNEEIVELKKKILDCQSELKESKQLIEQLQGTIDSLKGEVFLLKKKDFPEIEKSSKKKAHPPRVLKILNHILTEKKMIIGVLLTLVDKNNTGFLEIDEFVKRIKTYYPGFKKKYIQAIMSRVSSSSSCINLSDLEEYFEMFEYSSPVSTDSEEFSQVPEQTISTEPNTLLIQTDPTPKPSNSVKAVQHVFFRLQLNRIPEKSLFNLMFPSDSSEPLSAEEIHSIFQNPPFCLTENEWIEDLICNFPNTLTPSQFILALIELLPSWEILSEIEERVLDQQLNQIISSNFDIIYKACSLVDRKKQHFISVEEFFSVLRTLSIDINEKMQNYIRLLFYSYDMQLDIAPYTHFLQIYRKLQITNEERAAIVRTYLTRIAEVLKKNKITAIDVFSTNDLNIITEDYFYEGLERLGLFDIPKEHIDVLIESLQSEGDEVGVNLDELLEILTHYGVISNLPITEESRSLYSSFESAKKELSQIDESEDSEYSESYEEESYESH